MILIKFFITGVLYDCFKLISMYVNEGDKVSQTSGVESRAPMHNNFLVQIVQLLSEEGRVFSKKKKNSCVDFIRLILLFE